MTLILRTVGTRAIVVTDGSCSGDQRKLTMPFQLCFLHREAIIGQNEPPWVGMDTLWLPSEALTNQGAENEALSQRK